MIVLIGISSKDRVLMFAKIEVVRSSIIAQLITTNSWNNKRRSVK